MISFEIIKHQIGNSEVHSINARDLHQKLEVKKDFSNWIKYQFKRGFFIENTDYIRTRQKRRVGAVEKEITEYFLTLDTAKEIAMMSGTPKGKDVRNYFIEVEKQFRENKALEIKPKLDLTELLEDSKKALELIHLFENENPVNLIKLDRFMKKNEKVSPLELLEMDFKHSYFIPVELGNIIGKSPVEINQLLAKNGFQFRENGVWKTTEKGKEFSISFQNGSYFQIKWKLEVLI